MAGIKITCHQYRSSRRDLYVYLTFVSAVSTIHIVRTDFNPCSYFPLRLIKIDKSQRDDSFYLHGFQSVQELLT